MSYYKRVQGDFWLQRFDKFVAQAFGGQSKARRTLTIEDLYKGQKGKNNSNKNSSEHEETWEIDM